MTAGSDYDLFRGVLKETTIDRTESIIRKTAGKIKFSKTSAPQCARFSLDGRMLVTGTKDGFVEAWDFEKCKLRKDLEYQAKDEFMMHDEGVTAEAFSRDGEMLATGSESGKVKVWKLSTGTCLRRFEHAHSGSIHSIAFSRDGTQLLTASFDHLIRIHGLKSGQTLKEFQGHGGYVNEAIFSTDGTKVVSSSCDGTLKVRNAIKKVALHALIPFYCCVDLERQDDRVSTHDSSAKRNLRNRSRYCWCAFGGESIRRRREHYHLHTIQFNVHAVDGW